MFSSRLFSAESTPPAAQLGASKASPKSAAQGQGVEKAEEGKFSETFQTVTTSHESQGASAQKGSESSSAKSAASTSSAAAPGASGDEKSAQSPKASGSVSGQAETEPGASVQESGEVLASETGEKQGDTTVASQSASSPTSAQSDENLNSRQNNVEAGLDPSRKRQIMDDGEILLSRLAAAEKQLTTPAGAKGLQVDGLAEPETGQEQTGKELPLSAAGGMPLSAAMPEQAGTTGAADEDVALENSGLGKTGSDPAVLEAGLPTGKTALGSEALSQHVAVDGQAAALAQGASVITDPNAKVSAPGSKHAQMLAPQQAEWLQAVAQQVKAAAGAQSQSVDGTARMAPQAVAEAVSGSLGTGALSVAATIPQPGAAAMPGLIAATGEGAAVDASHAAMSKVQAEALTAGTLTQGALPHGAEANEGRGLEVAQAATSLGQQQGSNASPLRAEAAQAQTPLMLSKEQAGEQLAERVQVMVAKNLKHVDIRLDPPELGRLQIKLSLNQDQASVQFYVGNAQTRELVEQAMPRLRELMSQQGLQLAQSSVQQDSSRQQFAGQSGQQQQTNTGQPGSGQSGGQQGHSGSHAQQADGEPLEMYVSQPTDRVDYYA